MVNRGEWGGHHLPLVGAFLVLWCLFAGCGNDDRAVDAAAGPDRFPLDGPRLREGDIILGFGKTLTSLLITEYGMPAGRYSHSGLYYVGEDGTGRILSIQYEGLESVPPQEFFHHFSRLALVRLRGQEKTASLGNAARSFWRENRDNPVAFDCAFKKDADEGGAFYCNELISYLYRRCGHPEPFPRTPDMRETHWTRRVKEVICIDLVATVSPSAVLQNGAFEVLSEIQREETSRTQEVILRTILSRVRSYVRDGHYEPREPGLGSQIVLALEKSLVLRDYISRLASPRQRDMMYALREYIADCSKLTRYIMSDAGKNPDDLSTEEVRNLAGKVCDSLRDKHFRKETAAPTSSVK